MQPFDTGIYTLQCVAECVATRAEVYVALCVAACLCAHPFDTGMLRLQCVLRCVLQCVL